MDITQLRDSKDGKFKAKDKELVLETLLDSIINIFQKQYSDKK